MNWTPPISASSADRRIFTRASARRRWKGPGARSKAVIFPHRGSFPSSDLPVFKDGDQLRGTLVSAASGEPLRWRMPCGQEVDFQLGRVAGVRIAARDEGAAIGFRRAARIAQRRPACRRQFRRAWMKKRIQIRAAISRSASPFSAPERLEAFCGRRISPGPTGDFEVGNLAASRRRAMKSPAGPPPLRPAPGAWRYLDGQYVLWYPPPYGEPSGNLMCRLPASVERFEISFHAVHVGKYVISGLRLHF